MKQRYKQTGLVANWPMCMLLAATYAAWLVGTTWVAETSAVVATLLLVPILTLHASLSHEALHGHPFRREWLNTLLVLPAIGIAVPFLRFKDTHLAHHKDAVLTDPYDDPESNYLAPGVWQRLSRAVQALLRFNNTLLGRLLLGPAIGQFWFVKDDLRRALAGDRRVILGWGLHIVALVPVVAWLTLAGEMPAHAYLLAVYGSMSMLRLRTFLEHRAHEHVAGRTVVIEDRGLLALLFLNNNLHIVHHMYPTVPWHRLPSIYAADKGRFLSRNRGYRYSSYAEILKRYLFKSKDSVPHPLYRPRG